MVYAKYLEKCQSIQMVLTDVECVLTDGGVFHGEKGEEFRKFNHRDLMGATLLKQAGIRIGAITSGQTQSVHRGVSGLGFDFLYHGIQSKVGVIERILKEFPIHISEIAYIGDDFTDLSLIDRVGFFMTVLYGNPHHRKKADCVLKVKGGAGVIREAALMILNAKGCFEKTVERFLAVEKDFPDPPPLIQNYLEFNGKAIKEDSITPE